MPALSTVASTVVWYGAVWSVLINTQIRFSASKRRNSTSATPTLSVAVASSGIAPVLTSCCCPLPTGEIQSTIGSSLSGGGSTATRMTWTVSKCEFPAGSNARATRSFVPTFRALVSMLDWYGAIWSVLIRTQSLFFGSNHQNWTRVIPTLSVAVAERSMEPELVSNVPSLAAGVTQVTTGASVSSGGMSG